MGGRVAIALLHKYSERFHKVVLESCTPGIDNAIERDKRKVLDANLAKKITTIPLEEFLKSWYDNPLWGNIRQHKNFEHLLQKRLNNSVSKLAQSLVSMGTGTQESYWDAIKTFQFSTIFIAGEQDLKYTAIGKQMCASNKHIQLTIVPAAAHNIHFEKEHTFLAILNKFFT
jgi:2-succinyl-6-hydroxy-2,4-cyclohexadiene-1-carboxylate synthase